MKKIDDYLEWFFEWQEPLKDRLNVVFIKPNPLLPFKEKNVLIIERFDIIDTNKEKEYLDVIFDKAKELNITIYSNSWVGNLKDYMEPTKDNSIIKK
jgi:hypothetical protein